MYFFPKMILANSKSLSNEPLEVHATKPNVNLFPVEN